MDCKVTFLPSGESITINDSATIMDAERALELSFEYPCGGNGTCGKCLVDIECDGRKYRAKACTTKVSDGMVVTLPDDVGVHQEKVMTSGCPTTSCDMTSPLADYSNMSNAPLGIAFDIGTTTIAAYLLDLCSGEIIDTLGELNEQVKYGGDVISRCIYSLENGVDEISACVNDQTSKMIEKIIAKNGKNGNDVCSITIVGNTCMQHIYAGINPTTLVEIPYMPTKYGSFQLPAKGIINNVNENASIYFIPVIAGFIGADTVGAILATRFYQRDNTTLLLDIGTNGEMALGNKDRFVVCSTASGPAFEGAKIVCGMRGAPGAIDHIWMDGDELKYSTIDGLEAIGICGSGLIDFCRVILDTGVIMPSGRFDRKYEGSLASRIETIDGTKAFRLTDKVYVTQKDIREVQLAKGAIAAGIEIMAEVLGITYDDITKVLIAGAFGNYMDPDSTCRIGLIPSELRQKITPVGNAAGEGSKLCLLSSDEYKTCDLIAEKAEFIELASHEKFQEKFIAQLDF